MSGILEELKWETLQKRRKDNRFILIYKGLQGKARIFTDDLMYACMSTASPPLGDNVQVRVCALLVEEIL